MVKNQHYIPRMILKNFSDMPTSNSVYVFDKVRHKSYKKSIKDICSEEYLYELHDNKGNIYKPNIIENNLSKIEGKMNSVIKSIISGKCKLDNEDCATIWLFIIMQITRMPGFMKTSSECCAEEVFQDKQVSLSDEQKYNIYATFALPCYLSNYSEFINEFMMTYGKPYMHVIHTMSSTDVFCIGGDKPVVGYDNGDIDFPIAPHVLIRIRDNQLDDCYITHDEVSYINRIIFKSSELIYSSVPTNELPGYLVEL